MIEKALVEPKKEVPMREFSNELEHVIGQLNDAILALGVSIFPCLTPEAETRTVSAGKGDHAAVPLLQFSPLEVWLRERIAGVQDATRKINDLRERCSL